MPFEKGHSLSKGKGRPKGSISSRSIDFAQTLERHNFNPAEALIEIYKEARKTYDNYATIYEALENARIDEGKQISPSEDKADKYLKIALDAAKDLAGYAYPKLKAIEQVKTGALDNMTPEQRLEAMKLAVKMLEDQVKSGA